jgi:hypothetical protein
MSQGSGALIRTADGSRVSKRRMIVKGVLRPMGIVALTLLMYWLVPVEGATGSRAASLAAAVGIAVILAVFVRQLTRISKSAYPIEAALEAVGLVFGMFICLFAMLYVSISVGDPDAFSEVITKAGGIYFTVTVLATVGFGDITPATDTARLIVTLQMVIGMTLIGAAIKAFSFSAKAGVTARHPAEVADLNSRTTPKADPAPTTSHDSGDSSGDPDAGA